MQDIENILLATKRYSFLLKFSRDFFSQIALEVRCPNIAKGKARDSFQVLSKQDIYLLRSFALPITAYACKIGNVFCIQKAYRDNEEISPFHLSEFDILECGLCYTSCEEAMSIISNFLYSLQKAIPLSLISHPVNIEKNLCNIQHVKWIDAAQHLCPIEKNDLYHSPGPNHFLDLSHALNNLKPIFLTDIPYSRTSWASTLKAPNISSRFNLLCPDIGEIAEGSERNLDSNFFLKKFTTLGLMDKLGWYQQALDSSKRPLTVFAIGLERLAMWLFGYADIRDCHPFLSPYTPEQ